VGLLVLAPATSLPNAFTAVRLGLADRGAAVVSETLNSNTINLVVGVVVPALFVGLVGSSTRLKLDLAWLLGLTILCLLRLAQPHGMRRRGRGAVIGLYLAF